MEVYHYTRENYWYQMKFSGKLEPKGWFGPRTKGTSATFALLEAEPRNWTDEQRFPGTWTDLIKRVGMVVFSPVEVAYAKDLLILAVEVDPTNPNVFVADRGLWEIHERGLSAEMAGGRNVGEWAYYTSRVTLEEYIENERELGYLLPEVIITEEIPTSIIKPLAYQPFLEKELESWMPWKKRSKKFAAKWRADTYDLKDWYADYCSRNPDMKIGLNDFVGRFAENLGDRIFKL